MRAGPGCNVHCSQPLDLPWWPRRLCGVTGPGGSPLKSWTPSPRPALAAPHSSKVNRLSDPASLINHFPATTCRGQYFPPKNVAFGLFQHFQYVISCEENHPPKIDVKKFILFLFPAHRDKFWRILTHDHLCSQHQRCYLGSGILLLHVWNSHKFLAADKSPAAARRGQDFFSPLVSSQPDPDGIALSHIVIQKIFTQTCILLPSTQIAIAIHIQQMYLP